MKNKINTALVAHLLLLQAEFFENRSRENYNLDYKADDNSENKWTFRGRGQAYAAAAAQMPILRVLFEDEL